MFPRALGVRRDEPASVMPGRGNVLCASAFFVFRLSDGAHAEPSRWYEAVSPRMARRTNARRWQQSSRCKELPAEKARLVKLRQTCKQVLR